MPPTIFPPSPDPPATKLYHQSVDSFPGTCWYCGAKRVAGDEHTPCPWRVKHAEADARAEAGLPPLDDCADRSNYDGWHTDRVANLAMAGEAEE